MAYYVFGETDALTTDSAYSYANTLSIDIMQLFGEDSRFDECTQADILNLALVVLHAVMSDNNVSDKELHKFIDDFEEFKNFSMYTMNHCRQSNAQCNDIMLEMLEKEVQK